MSGLRLLLLAACALVALGAALPPRGPLAVSDLGPAAALSARRARRSAEREEREERAEREEREERAEWEEQAESCERLRLCRLHAGAAHSPLAAFQLYFVNRENARLWDHAPRALADCERRFACAR